MFKTPWASSACLFYSMCVDHRAFLSVESRSVVVEGRLGEIKVERADFSAKEEYFLLVRVRPWSRDGMEEGGARAHEKKESPEELETGETDREGDAWTAVEGVWFSDESLVRTEKELKVVRGHPRILLVQLKPGAEVAQVEWEAKEVVSPVQEVTYSPCRLQCWRLLCNPAGNGHTP